MTLLSVTAVMPTAEATPMIMTAEEPTVAAITVPVTAATAASQAKAMVATAVIAAAVTAATATAAVVEPQMPMMVVSVNCRDWKPTA